MKNEDSLDADEHYKFVDYTLRVKGKSFDNVIAISGDKTSTNKALAPNFGPIFVGCFSHLFNLAMNDILQGYDGLIKNIKALMKKLTVEIRATKLRGMTSRSAQIANVTQWSSM